MSHSRMAPTAHAFAKKVGVDVAQLERVTTSKGDSSFRHNQRPACSGDPGGIPSKGNRLGDWPSNMYWRKPSERFVRPVRWVVAMLDDQVVPLEFDGVRAGKESRGHRILSSSKVAVFPRAMAMGRHRVPAKVLGRQERATANSQGSRRRYDPGRTLREDKSPLETVVNLTEWPSVVLGSFDREYLQLPEEVLVTVDAPCITRIFCAGRCQGKLLPNFLTVSNTMAIHKT